MFGQVPILEVDGKPLAQSNAAARYVARQHGLAGQNDWDQSQADMYVDCISDLITGTARFINGKFRLDFFLIICFLGMRPIIYENDPEKQKELFQKVSLEKLLAHYYPH